MAVKMNGFIHYGRMKHKGKFSSMHIQIAKNNELNLASERFVNTGEAEMWVQPLSLEDPLGQEMAICSNGLAWRIPQTEELGGLILLRVTKSWT